jgi:hypothetical protein
VIVHGTRAKKGGMVHVPAGGVRVLASHRKAEAREALGTQRLAVFLLNFQNDHSQPWTTDFVRAKYFTSPDSMAAYYHEQSFGKTTITGDVLGWYTLPTTNESCDPNGFASMARAAATAAGVNLSQYTQAQYVIGPGAPCGWAGLAYVPGTTSWVNGTIQLRVIAHEYGHNLGAHHASSLDCRNTDGQRVALSVNNLCGASEYGDPYDVMGIGMTNHMNNFHKGQLGWYDPASMLSVTQPGDYTLVVEDETGKYGPNYIYRVHATAATPDFQVSISPDNPNVGAGTSVFLPVRVRRRVGVTGPISVVFPNLPPGVTASPTVILPDQDRQNQAFVVLTAAADAQPGSFLMVRPVARATVDGKVIEREVQPNEVYLINGNNQRPTPRSNMVVTVGPQPDWSVTLEPSSRTMAAGGAPIEVKVHLTRKGADRDMPFAILGMPQGVQAPGSLLFKKGQTELSFTMRPSNGGIFATKTADGSPAQFLVTIVNGREGEGMQFSSPAIPITVSAGKSP